MHTKFQIDISFRLEVKKIIYLSNKRNFIDYDFSKSRKKIILLLTMVSSDYQFSLW